MVVLLGMYFLFFSYFFYFFFFYPQVVQLFQDVLSILLSIF